MVPPRHWDRQGGGGEGGMYPRGPEKTGPEHNGSVGSRVVTSVQVVGRGLGGIRGDRCKAALW